jgi:Aspartyl protease
MSMGRIRTETKINGKAYWTLFDSGARNTYMVRQAASGLDLKNLPAPQVTNLGGKAHQVQQVCVLLGEIEDHSVQTLARVIDEIGEDDDGRPIEILFGALSMQEWGIRLDLQAEKLDWSRYTNVFVEF